VRERRVEVPAAHGRIAAQREAARQHAHVVDGAREVRGTVGVGVGIGEVAGKHGRDRAAEERTGLTAPIPQRACEGECLAARAPGFCHVAAAKRLHVAQEQPDARRVRRSGGRRAPDGFSRRSGLREGLGGPSQLGSPVARLVQRAVWHGRIGWQRDPDGHEARSNGPHDDTGSEAPEAATGRRPQRCQQARRLRQR
jgi:hypothetical protein